MNLLFTIERINQVDQLIRLKATGTPQELANRLDISVGSVYNLIKTLKDFGAPVYYCKRRRSYCYRQKCYFDFGFFSQVPENKINI